MNAITSRLAPLSVAAAGVLAVAGAAQADSRHHRAYSHLPHTHTYSHAHGSAPQWRAGDRQRHYRWRSAARRHRPLLDALSDSNTNTNANVSISTHIGSSGPVLTWTPPAYKPPVVAPPTHAPAPQYTTKCRDHGHISVVKDGPRQFSLRRPDGAVLAQIEGGRPLQRKIASALDTFGIDSTCVVKTERHGRIEKTRFFLADGRLPRVPLHWSGADEVQRINPDYLIVVHTGAGFGFVAVAGRPSPVRTARPPTPTSPISTGWARANGSCSRTASADEVHRLRPLIATDCRAACLSLSHPRAKARPLPSLGTGRVFLCFRGRRRQRVRVRVRVRGLAGRGFCDGGRGLRLWIAAIQTALQLGELGLELGEVARLDRAKTSNVQGAFDQRQRRDQIFRAGFGSDPVHDPLNVAMKARSRPLRCDQRGQRPIRAGL